MSGNLTVWKRAVPRNRMREIFTYGSVGGLVEQSPILPGQVFDLGILTEVDRRIRAFQGVEHDSPGVFVVLRPGDTARGHPNFEPLARWTDEGKGDMAILGQLALHGVGVLEMVQVKMHKPGRADEFLRPGNIPGARLQGAT